MAGLLTVPRGKMVRGCRHGFSGPDRRAQAGAGQTVGAGARGAPGGAVTAREPRRGRAATFARRGRGLSQEGGACAGRERPRPGDLAGVGRGGFWAPPDGVTPTRRVQAADSGPGSSPAAAHRARRTPAGGCPCSLRGERRVEELADHHRHPRPREPLGWSHLGALPPAGGQVAGLPSPGDGDALRVRGGPGFAPGLRGGAGEGLLCACARSRPVPPLDRPEAGGHVRSGARVWL